MTIHTAQNPGIDFPKEQFALIGDKLALVRGHDSGSDLFSESGGLIDAHDLGVEVNRAWQRIYPWNSF
ncbi:MAG: hypothetical protein U0670_23325 [Anaerolineae bacterium]